MRKLIHPYNSIDWTKQWKANLHTHTKATKYDTYYGSDGVFTPTEVIDLYADKNYDILAITDHDTAYGQPRMTWPWTRFGRDPETLGMLAIQGVEMSKGDHICSLFNNLAGVDSDDEAVVLQAIKDNGGLAVINHPGRYSETVQFYVDLFLQFKDITLGLEVHNQGNRYPNDRKLWDLINAITIPEGKVVNGWANDDMHDSKDRFITYNFILAPTLTESAIKSAMQAGKTYFSYEIGDPTNGGSGEAKAPRISNVVVDEINKTVTLTVDSGTIIWVTEGTVEVGTGTTFDYADFDKSFFRAVITNEYGITYTQPFALVEIQPIQFKKWHEGRLLDVEFKKWDDGVLKDVEFIE